MSCEEQSERGLISYVGWKSTISICVVFSMFITHAHTVPHSLAIHEIGGS